MKPKVSEAADKLLLSYDLPRRVYCSKVYPIASPNGSSIIIYGHELGIGIIWRGGRSFKIQEKPSGTKLKTNGTGNDAIMIIDSDEDEAPGPAPQAHSEAEFEEEEPELDTAEPFYPIIRRIEIPLGAKVMALSVPQISSENQSLAYALPPILGENIVVAVVCSDCTTKLISLPLIPPPHTAKVQKNFSSSTGGVGRWGERVLTISGAATHQDVASDVAITFTSQFLWAGPRRGSIPHDTSLDAEAEDQTSGSRSRASGARSKSSSGDGWDLLMATYSREASGALLVYRIPILEEKNQSQTHFKFSQEDTLPVQGFFLQTQATKLSFNPSPFPSERHSHILISTTSGAVKVYACISPRTDRPRGRLTPISDQDSNRKPDGKWLISLYPGFSMSQHGIPQRKPVLDAEWVLGGKAIISLLSDGEWGIWDIEGSGPGATQSLVRGQSNIQGVTGGALTSFAVNGWITASDSPKSSAVTTRETSKPKLAPMTPGTRKIREDTLFKKIPASDPPVITNLSTNGRISVLANTTTPRDTQYDESIVLNYSTQNIVIPSLLSLWRTKVKTGGTYESSARFRPSPLEGITLQGEHQLGIAQFPPMPKSAYRGCFPPSSAPHPDVLIVAEHRLLILAAPRYLDPKRAEAAAAAIKPAPTQKEDRALLSRGKLDVEGIGRVLEGMTNGTGNAGNNRASVSRRTSSPSKRRRVDFA